MRAAWPCTVLLAFVPVITLASDCSLIDDVCICEDDAGQQWDLSPLEASTRGEQGGFVARGVTTGCSICQGDWVYHFDFCANVAVPQALGCTAATQTSMVRLDEYTIPTSRTCEIMGPDLNANGNLLVSQLSGVSSGVEITWSHLQRTFRLSVSILYPLGILIGRLSTNPTSRRQYTSCPAALTGATLPAAHLRQGCWLGWADLCRSWWTGGGVHLAFGSRLRHQ
jgi:hypothetical protein